MGPGGAAGRGSVGARGRIALVVGIYCALSGIAYWGLLVGSATTVLSPTQTDPSQTVWFVGWFAHAVAAGHNPLLTAAMNVPAGYNLAQNTSVPLLALVATPITLWAGPIVAAKALVLAAMPASAAAAYLVLRRWQVWEPAAAFGGLMYGYSPYMVDQGAVHLHLTFVPLPPVILSLLAHVIACPDVSSSVRRRRIIWLAAAAAGQYLISPEVLAMTGVVGLAALLFVWVRWASISPRGAVDRRRGIAELVMAGGVSAAAVAYPVWLQFFGPLHYRGTVWPVRNSWYADLAAMVAPSHWQAIKPFLATQGNTLSQITRDETTAYIGIGVLLVGAFLAGRAQQSAAVRLAAWCTLVSLILSLGPVLVVDGRTMGFPMPFRLLATIPLFSSILPVRFALFTGAGLAAVTAFAMSFLHAQASADGRPSRRWLMKPLAVAGFVTVTWLPAWPYAAGATTLPPKSLSGLSGRVPLLLTYPYPSEAGDQALVWQAARDFSFRVLGGYAYRAEPSGKPTLLPPLLRPAGIQEWLVGEQTGFGRLYPKPPAYGDVLGEVKPFIAMNRVDGVLVDTAQPKGLQVEGLFHRALGAPSADAGPFVLWRIGGPRQ